MFILDICGNSTILNTILFIKNILSIIFIIVPIVLVLFFTIDLAKNVISKDDQETQKNLKLGIKRIIYSIVIMFIPLLVKTFMGMLSGYSKVSFCYTKATESYVRELKDAEDKEYKTLQQKKLEERQKTSEQIAEEKREAEEKTKKIEEEAIKNKEEAAQNRDNIINNAASTTAEKIAVTAESLAWPAGTSESTYKSKPYGDSNKLSKKYNIKGKLYDCGAFAQLVGRVALDSKKFPNPLGVLLDHKSSKKAMNNAVAKYGLEAIKWDGKMSSLKRGDFITYKKPGYTGDGHGQHAMVYLGTTKKGRPKVAEGSRGAHQYGHIKTKTAGKGQFNLNNYAYYYILRAK